MPEELAIAEDRPSQNEVESLRKTLVIYKGEVDRLRGVVSELLEEPKWKPINTYRSGVDPKGCLVCGGEYIDSSSVYIDSEFPPTSTEQVLGVWMAGYDEDMARKSEFCWNGGLCANDGELWLKPTHWMPLPKAPGGEE